MRNGLPVEDKSEYRSYILSFNFHFNRNLKYQFMTNKNAEKLCSAQT